MGKCRNCGQWDGRTNSDMDVRHFVHADHGKGFVAHFETIAPGAGFCPHYGHTPHMTALLELARRGAEIGAARERERIAKDVTRAFDIPWGTNASNGEV